MRVLGINRSEFGSIALLNGQRIEVAIAKERLCRKKHAWGALGDLREIYGPKLAELEHAPEIIVECYASDPQRKQRRLFMEEIEEVWKHQQAPRVLEVSHHLAHVYSVIPFIDPAKTVVLVADACGSYCRDIAYNFPRKQSTDEKECEVCSAYIFDETELSCIFKQTARPYFDNHMPVAQTYSGLGQFYFSATQTLFPGEGNEGKVMGLAPYGSPRRLHLPELEFSPLNEIVISNEWLSLFREKNKYLYPRQAESPPALCADLAAATQSAYTTALLRFCEYLRKKSGKPELAIVGGCGLNSVGNGRLVKEGIFEHIHVLGVPHDTGSSLGAAYYGQRLTGERLPSRIEYSDFLGPKRQADIAAARKIIADNASLELDSIADPAETVVSQLLEGKIVALFQERSEFGQRALGNRSILADARNPEAKDVVNHLIKKRENFRPFAPVVMEEYASAYFSFDQSSPFMSFVGAATARAKSEVPAIVHVDGSVRLQTLRRAQNPLLYSILQKFREKTSTPVLLNTSFNLNGEPLVETAEDALHTLLNSELHTIVFETFVVRKRV